MDKWIVVEFDPFGCPKIQRYEVTANDASQAINNSGIDFQRVIGVFMKCPIEFAFGGDQ